MNRKIVKMPRPVGESMWIVTNGFRTVAICRFKSDALATLANLKTPGFWIQKGAR